MARQRRSGPKPAPPVPYQPPKGKVQEEQVSEMSRGEFRVWVNTLPEKERWIWREYRHSLAKQRYDERRLFILANPPLPARSDEVEKALKKIEGRTTEWVRQFVASLPEDVRIEVRRQLKREAYRRWRERHAEQHRARARTNWEKLKADPERYAAYLEKRRVQMREKRAQERSAEG